MIKFESKDEARVFYKEWVRSNSLSSLSFVDWCHENGYMKKTPLEEACDKYYEFASHDAVIDYIRELENEIGRLKGDRTNA